MNWNKPVCEWGKSGVWTVTIGLLIYAIVGAALVNRWDHRHGVSIRELGFGYGVLIEAIETTGDYKVCEIHYPGVCFSAHRLPLIPASLMTGASLVGDDQARITLLKSGIMTGGLAVILIFVMRFSTVPTGWFIIGTLGMLSMPRWVITFFALSVEEAYLSVPLALILTLALFGSKRWWRSIWAGGVLGSLLVVLLFLKNSMPFLCVALPLLIWWTYRNTRTTTVALLIVVVGTAALAAFNRANSGQWTIGSSWAGWNLYKGNNSATADFYPRYSLDLLDYEDRISFEDAPTDEWDYDHQLKEQAWIFIRENPLSFVKLSLLKAWVFLVDVRPNGAQNDEPGRADFLKLLQVGWMVAFRVILWAVIIRAGRDLLSLRWTAPEFCAALLYYGFMALYGGFYVVGFAYERHVVPIMLPTILVFWWQQSTRDPKKSDQLPAICSAISSKG